MADTIALITDSTCDIPQAIIEQHNIYVTAQHIIWGTEDLLDGVDITSGVFYERLKTDDKHPKTSQPIAAEFTKVIQQAKEDGATEAVIMTLSNQMSGTHDSAVGAKEDADIPIHVYDSLSTSMGLGWQVIAAARARENGADAAGMLKAAKALRQRLHIRFSVDTLDYLHKGGRIGGAAKLVGTALNLKPELYVDHQVGRVEAGERTRTRKRALAKLYDSFFTKVGEEGALHAAVLHAAAEDDAQRFAERIREEHDPAELFITPIAAVIGVHVGPGSIALAGYREV
jgi:DegV family protein with EDD domain